MSSLPTPNEPHTNPQEIILEATFDKSPDSPKTVLSSLWFVFLLMAQKKSLGGRQSHPYWLMSKDPKGKKVSE